MGGIASLDNVLKIEGGAGENDTLTLDATSEGWVAAGTQPLTGYTIYETANVRIAVNDEIAVTLL